jgi:protein tyrosine phosphatase (PTP) superfamily phosphohydrolase (DUF442 family)
MHRSCHLFPARRWAQALLWIALSAAGTAAVSQGLPPGNPSGAPLDAPNVVVIGPELVTSGQPTATALAGLGKLGFAADIYLAPITVSGAVRDEPDIVQRQGLAYVNIPIRFNEPTEADFDAFAAAMSKFQGRKVLVHCQVNMRASSMVFLYRALVLKVPPEQAYESVAAVWSPEGPWKALMVDELRKHGLAFEPY